MKKFLSVVLAVLMCVLPLVGNMPVAAEEEALAFYYFEDAEGYIGEYVLVPVYLETEETFNTIGLADITYDEDILEYAGYVEVAELKDAAELYNVSIPPTAGATKYTFSAAFQANPQEGYSDYVVVLKFKIKSDASVGETEITAVPAVKNNSDVITSDVFEGTIEILPEREDLPELDFADKTVVYDGEAHDIKIEFAEEGKYEEFEEYISYTIGGKDFDPSEAVNAGKYNVTAVVDCEDYKKFEKTATLTIEKKPATVTVIVPGKEYDGTNKLASDAVVEVVKEGLIDGEDFTVTVTQKNLKYSSKNAGEQEITYKKSDIKYPDAVNYEVELVVPNAVITKKPVTVTVDVPGKTYDGTNVVALEDGDFAITEGKLVSGDAFNYIYGDVVYDSADAGTRAIDTDKIVIEGSDNYEVTIVANKAEISKKDIEVYIDNVDLMVGDPKPESYTWTTVPELTDKEAELVITFNDSAVNTEAEGEYELKGEATEVDNPNYNITKIENGKVIVTDRLPQEIEIISLLPEEPIVYGSEEFAASAEGAYMILANHGEVANTAAEIEYRSDAPEVATVDKDGMVTLVGAGTAKIYVEVKGDEVYKPFSEYREVTVTKKPATVTVNVPSKEYDGTTAVAFEEENFVTEGLVGEDKFEIDYSAATYPSANAGKYTVDKNLIVIGGADNYNVEVVVNEAEITKKDATVTVNVPSKEYDGTTLVPFTAENFVTEGLVGDDKFEIDYSAATYPSANVDTYLISEDAFVISGADNYDVTVSVSEAVITKKPATVTVNIPSKEYDGTTVIPFTEECFVTEGLVGDDKFEIDYAAAAFTSASVGTYTVDEGAFIVSGADNYDVTVSVNGAEITKKSATVTVNVPSKEYDGTTLVPFTAENFVTEGLVGEEELEIDYSMVVYPSANVGKYTVDKELLIINGADNYDVAVTVSEAEITKKDATVTVNVPSKEYDGTTVIPFTEECFVTEGLVGEDKFEIDYSAATYPSANAGKYTVDKNLIVIGGADNYNVEVVVNEAEITKKDATVTVTVPGKTYDGKATVALDGITEEVIGLVGEDKFEIDYSAVVYPSANAGKYTVDKNLIVIGGADNYNVEVVVNETEIAQKKVKVTIDDVLLVIGEAKPESYTWTTEPKLSDAEDKLVIVVDDNGANTDAVAEFDLTGTAVEADNPNYVIEEIKSGKFSVVNKYKQGITSVAEIPAEIVYGDDNFKATYKIEVTETENKNNDEGVKTTFRSENEKVATVDENGVVTLVGAGETNVYVERAGNDKYLDYSEAIAVSVAKKAATVTVTIPAKEYDGNDVVALESITATVEGLVGEDKFEIDYSAVAYTSENAGKHTIGNDKVTVLGADNYDVTVVVNETEITKKPVTVTVAIPSKEYDGKDTVALDGITAEITEGALVEGDEFKYNYDAVVYPEAAAGKHTVEKSLIAISGADNYEVTVVVLEAEITPLTISIEELTEETISAGLASGELMVIEGVYIDFNKTIVEYVPAEEGGEGDDGSEGEGGESGDGSEGEGEGGEGEGESGSAAKGKYVIRRVAYKGENAGNYVPAEDETIEIPEDLVPAEVKENIAVISDAGTANGSIEGLGSYLMSDSSVITLTAVPSDSYEFNGWTVNGKSVEGDKVYNLVFEAGVKAYAVKADFRYIYSGSGGSFGGGGGGGSATRTVTFVIDGDNKTQIKIDKGDKLKDIAVPEKEGFVFGGWFKDAACTQEYDLDTKVTSNLTLYAKWIEEEPKVDEPKEEDPKEEDPTEWTNTYSDVKADDWYYEAVKTVSEMGIMNGMKEGEFAPNVQLTRAMLVTMLYRIEGAPEANGEVAYTDVNLGEYYGDALVWATENKIVNGVTETEFAPAANITREQIATIIFRYAALKGIEAVELSENLHFSDADKISGYAVAPMNWLVGKEIIKGYEDGSIKPQGNATRAEVATIVTRILAFLG